MSSFNNTTIILVQPLYPSQPIQFSILLIATISLYSMLHLCSQPLYDALNNHVIIFLFVNNCIQTPIDVPMSLGYYISGIIWPSTLLSCYVYNFLDYFFLVSLLLHAWASIERHIFSFHAYVFNSHKIVLCVIIFLLVFVVFIHSFTMLVLCFSIPAGIIMI